MIELLLLFFCMCVQIRFMAHQFTGTIAVHCHLTYHSNLGMMVVVDAVADSKNGTLELC